jgi:leucyl-tRNA---protein transferase
MSRSDPTSDLQPLLAGDHCHYPAISPPARVTLVQFPDHLCPYFHDRMATYRGFSAPQMAGSAYHDFMDAGFRRSGKLIYQPVCSNCRACRQIRVATAAFKYSKSQRRAWNRNENQITVTVATPTYSDEKFDLYRKYLQVWHGNDDAAEYSREGFIDFLHATPVGSVEFVYRDKATQQLLGVGICDACERSISSVYFYFDPEQKDRSLGTFSALVEIETAHSRNIPYWYPGYWVNGSKSMQYKTSFKPCEILGLDGIWRPLEQEFPEAS